MIDNFAPEQVIEKILLKTCCPGFSMIRFISFSSSSPFSFYNIYYCLLPSTFSFVVLFSTTSSLAPK